MKNGRSVGTTFLILAVADIGKEANYKTEVRHQLSLSFSPNSWNPVLQLQELCEQIHGLVGRYLPANGSFHAWLLDPHSKKPSLFLTGLLAVQQGRCAEAEAEELNRLLVPQVTCRQYMRSVDFRFDFVTSVFVPSHEWEGGNREEALLARFFPNFNIRFFLDAEASGSDLVNIQASIGHTCFLSVPFTVSKEWSSAQYSYVFGVGARTLHELAKTGSSTVEVKSFSIWHPTPTRKKRQTSSGRRSIGCSAAVPHRQANRIATCE